MRVWAVVALLGVCCIVCAQTEAKPEFEVATVKPAAPLTGLPPPRGGPGSKDPENVDNTGLTGEYDYALRFKPAGITAQPDADSDASAIRTYCGVNPLSRYLARTGSRSRRLGGFVLSMGPGARTIVGRKIPLSG